MHEGHHGILEDVKKDSIKVPHSHQDHNHNHSRQQTHNHPHAHEQDPISCETCDKPSKFSSQSGLWQKIIAGGVVALLVAAFFVWKLF